MTDRDPGVRPGAAYVAGALAQVAWPATGLTRPLEVSRPKRSPRPTMLLPARSRSRSTPRVSVRGALIGVGAVLAAATAAVVVLLPRADNAPAPVPAPTTFPSVGGQLGADLNQLERVIP